MLDLRYYQRDSIDAIYNYWGSGGGNPLVVLPTGSGKALVIAKLFEELLAGYPRMRMLNLIHSKTLVEQNYLEFVGLSPFAPAGIYSAGLNRRDIDAQVLFAGIQSTGDKDEVLEGRDLVLVDEAHAIPRNTDTLYGKFFKRWRELNPDGRVAGLTATDYRLDSGRLTEGDDRMFDEVVYEISIRELIDKGFLSPLSSKPGDVMIDLSGVHRRGGEFIPGEVEAAADKIEITRAAVRQAIERGHDRKAWLFFCSGQDHADHVRDELLANGISAASLTSRTTGQKRIIDDFKAGRIRALASANMLTTGFNVPQVDLISMLRPTESTGLYVQICGRGTRLSPGKKDCLILDHAGNVARHGPVDMVDPKKPSKGMGEAPTKLCPTEDGGCNEILHISVMVCPSCGYQFPPSEEVKITATASSAPVLSTEEPPWLAVSGQTFAYHEGKYGKPPSVRCEFTVEGHRIEKTWFCPEHFGRPKVQADRFWHRHGGELPYPSSVDEWLNRAGELAVTAEVQIKYGKGRGSYNEVLDWKAGEGSYEAPKGNLVLAPRRRSGLVPFGTPKPTFEANWDDDIPF